MERLRHINNRIYLRSLQGVIVALIGPLVWLSIDYINHVVLNSLVSQELLLVLYLTIGTLVVFPSFGAYLGYRETQAHQRALIDPLTNLYNVRYFRQRLDELIAEHARKRSSLYIAIFDIDHFKTVNDTYGHSAGDKVLEVLALQVKQSLRKYDCLARVGGEEFAILYSTAQPFDIVNAAERIRNEVEQLEVPIDKTRSIRITISLGLTSYRKSDSKDSFYARADKVMYQAKVAGRNQVKFDLDL
ncbi:GGDEF domain-containing protein [Vibrio sp. T11.5]|uniref:GGDEF domain-containing protein n=1 Tax=Vibrio sp. T11.5 TaxID=2998836 RepID=UPI0022CD7A59|nr:GGDEF domain-containing protein [Vibrio sp. T11.5]MDA0118564.1 GGDEF domain-containing protein [Vibrio sp. T11.5]